MKKKLLWGVAAVLLLALVAAGIAAYWLLPLSVGGTAVRQPAPLPGDTLLTAEQVRADRQQLIDYVESVHPFFVDGSDQTAYRAAKEAYLAEIDTIEQYAKNKEEITHRIDELIKRKELETIREIETKAIRT